MLITIVFFSIYIYIAIAKIASHLQASQLRNLLPSLPLSQYNDMTSLR